MYQHPVSQNAGGFISVLFTEFSEAGSDVMEGDDGGAGIESKTIVLADDHGSFDTCEFPAAIFWIGSEEFSCAFFAGFWQILAATFFDSG